MTIDEARSAGQTDTRFNHAMGVFAVMQIDDGSYTYGLEDTSLPKSKEEAQARPRVVERWMMQGFGWRQLFL